MSKSKTLSMVVGFMFNTKETDVLLIEKTHPAWQAGKLNGIGGKCKQGESYKDCMVREFKEECGIEHHDWEEVVFLFGDGWEVMVYGAKSDNVFDFKQIEDEKVLLVPIAELDSFDHISNLRWLIPMCLDSNIDYNIQIFKQ